MSYVIVYEDPEDLDAPARVVTPGADFFEHASRGGVLMDAREVLARARGSTFDESKTAGPMTNQEAMVWLLLHSVPERVWNSNSQMYSFVEADTVPRDRTFRSAWKMVL